MRIAVFRAIEDGRRTAVLLAELGHEAVLAPVLRIVPTGRTVQAGDTDGLVFTSAHAPAALASHPDGVTAIRDLPCWCVGPRTAEAARTAGFNRVSQGPGTGAALAAAILADSNLPRLTLVAGRERKPDFERDLARAGSGLAVVEAYEAQAVPLWTEDIVGSLAEVAIALHYSHRSAILARRLAEAAGLREHFRRWVHCCLSADAATGLGQDAVTTVIVARRPDEGNLLEVLDAAPFF